MGKLLGTGIRKYILYYHDNNAFEKLVKYK